MRYRSKLTVSQLSLGAKFLIKFLEGDIGSSFCCLAKLTGVSHDKEMKRLFKKVSNILSNFQHWRDNSKDCSTAPANRRYNQRFSHIWVNKYLQMETDRLQKFVGGVSRQEGHKEVLKGKKQQQQQRVELNSR